VVIDLVESNVSRPRSAVSAIERKPIASGRPERILNAASDLFGGGNRVDTSGRNVGYGQSVPISPRAESADECDPRSGREFEARLRGAEVETLSWPAEPDLFETVFDYATPYVVTVGFVRPRAEDGAALKKQTIHKTVSVLAMVLDQARIQPNPARDKLTVKMPREERRELQPPTAEHVEAVVRLLPTHYRLPALVLEATGMRIGELEGSTGATWTSLASAGASQAPWRRPAALGGSRCRKCSFRP
jgi:hypothetical protein